MACGCQLSAVAAGTMVLLVLGAAIATLTSVILAQEPHTPGRFCYRKCVEGDTRVCEFNFDVHPYQTMSRACYDCPHNATDCSRPDCIAGDGVTRRIMVINKQMPGPPIQVCLGDRVVVNVKNSLHSDGLTIHWHGLTMRGASTAEPDCPSKATPYMDGTPGITQCDIAPHTSFRYSFIATNAGTHFYHSHSGFQRGDGVYGAFIVREPDEYDPNRYTYDYDLPEHVILIHDWLHLPTQDKFLFRHHSGGDDFPKSMLVNGHGPHQHALPNTVPSLVPYSVFKVIPGNRYRLRFISNAILNCPIVVSVEDHSLTVIASDGNPLVPVNASSIVVYAGERWDVVLTAEYGKSGYYWMSFFGGVDCAETKAHQFALLQYEDLPDQTVKGGTKGVSTLDPVTYPDSLYSVPKRTLSQKPNYTMEPPSGVQVNSINRACTDDLRCVAWLRSYYPMAPEAMRPVADFTYYLAFEMNRIHNAHYYSRSYYNFDLLPENQQIPTPQINNLTFAHPATPLLLGGAYGEDICNVESPLVGRSCHDDYCECLHMYSIPLGATVDLVFIDEGQYGDENHPIHMHGGHFWVLAQDRPNDVDNAFITRSQVIEMDKQGLIERNLVNPPYKDTVTIPDGGYTVVRFAATNPGYWLLHCHLLFHSAAGMDLVIKIGEDSDIPRPPPNFPTCGNFRSPDL